MTTETTGNAPKLGILCLLGFVVGAAVRDVFLGHLFGDLGLYEVATLAFGSGALVFGIGLLLFRRHQLAMLMADWRTVIALNVTTAISWLSYFQALRMVEPAAVNLAFCGVAPLAVAGLAAFGLSSAGEFRPAPAERAVHWGLLATVVAVAVIVVAGLSGAGAVDPLAGLGGVALAALAGVTITAETIFAKRMNIAGVSPLAIVGVRFLLVTAIAGTLMAGLDAPYAGLAAVDLVSLAGVFLLILIVPIYLVQTGVALTSPLVSGVICALGPVATLALQALVGGWESSGAMLGVTAVYAGLAVLGAWWSARRIVADDSTVLLT